MRMGTVPNRSRPVRRSRLGCARVARYSIAPCSVSRSSPDDSEMPSKYLDGRAPGCNPLMSAFGLRARQRYHLPIPSWSLWLTQWVIEPDRATATLALPPLPRSRRILGSTWGVNTAPPAGASAQARRRQARAFSRAMRWTAPGFGDLARRVLRRSRSASGAAGAAPGSFHADRLAAKHRCPPLFLGRRRPRDLGRSHWTEPGSPARTDSAA